MIGKELKSLSRRELVDVIYQLKKNEQAMQEQIASLEEALQDKRIRISVAGSVAEAAVDVTNLLTTAQSTADLYLQEIACMKEDTQRECAKMLEDAQKQAETTLAESQRKCAELNARYQSDYEKLQQLHAQLRKLAEVASEGMEDGR